MLTEPGGFSIPATGGGGVLDVPPPENPQSGGGEDPPGDYDPLEENWLVYTEARSSEVTEVSDEVTALSPLIGSNATFFETGPDAITDFVDGSPGHINSQAVNGDERVAMVPVTVAASPSTLYFFCVFALNADQTNGQERQIFGFHGGNRNDRLIVSSGQVNAGGTNNLARITVALRAENGGWSAWQYETDILADNLHCVEVLGEGTSWTVLLDGHPIPPKDQRTNDVSDYVGAGHLLLNARPSNSDNPRPDGSAGQDHKFYSGGLATSRLTDNADWRGYLSTTYGINFT